MEGLLSTGPTLSSFNLFAFFFGKGSGKCMEIVFLRYFCWYNSVRRIYKDTFECRNVSSIFVSHDYPNKLTECTCNLWLTLPKGWSLRTKKIHTLWLYFSPKSVQISGPRVTRYQPIQYPDLRPYSAQISGLRVPRYQSIELPDLSPKIAQKSAQRVPRYLALECPDLSPKSAQISNLKCPGIGFLAMWTE